MPVPFQAVRRRTLKSLASCAHVPLKGQKKKKVKMLKGRRETAGDGWPPACKNRDPSFSSHAVNAAAFWILPRLYTRLGLRPFFFFFPSVGNPHSDRNPAGMNAIVAPIPWPPRHVHKVQLPKRGQDARESQKMRTSRLGSLAPPNVRPPRPSECTTTTRCLYKL